MRDGDNRERKESMLLKNGRYYLYWSKMQASERKRDGYRAVLIVNKVFFQIYIFLNTPDRNVYLYWEGIENLFSSNSLMMQV